MAKKKLKKANFKTLDGILDRITDTADTFEDNHDMPTAAIRLSSCGQALKVHALQHAIYRFQTERIDNAQKRQQNLLTLPTTTPKNGKSKRLQKVL